MKTYEIGLSGKPRLNVRLFQTAGWGAMLMALATPVWAQQQPIPPEHYTLDARGVDLVTGGFAYQTADVVIGDPGQGGLVHGRAYVNGGWRDTLSGTIGVSGTVYTVSLGAEAELFVKSGTTFTPTSNRGATLVQTTASLLTFTTSDGTVAEYSTVYSGSTIAYAGNNAALISVRRPNGERLNYHWNGVTYCDRRSPGEDPEIPGECELWRNAVRLDAVSNNRGYQVNFQYASNAVPEDGREARGSWLRRIGARGINLAIDSARPTEADARGPKPGPALPMTPASTAARSPRQPTSRGAPPTIPMAAV